MKVTWIFYACDADYNKRVGNCLYRRRFTLEEAIRSYEKGNVE